MVLQMSGWKRKRQDVADATGSSALEDQVQSADRLGADVLDLTAAGEAERYSAWAGRMRAKRDRDQATILGDRPQPAADNWSTASTIGMGGEDHPLIDHARPDDWETARALEALGLDRRAGSAEMAAAFRNLAKLHHPDRWAEAESDVQREHAEAMLQVNAAYRTLRGPASVG